jgi:hypothetical protein
MRTHLASLAVLTAHRGPPRSDDAAPPDVEVTTRTYAARGWTTRKLVKPCLRRWR